jgi:ssDNA-binding replication factor A large subunit
MKETWKTTKEHIFNENGPFGSKVSVCGQVSDSQIRIKCEKCKRIIESGKNRQLKLGEGSELPSPE